jgi:hypothetical protein
MRALSSPAKRFALNLGLVVAGFIVAPAACFYPSYTYENGGSAGANQGGSGGAGGSAGSSSTGEDCTNGIDDNGDGNVDCEDPGCGAFACVSEAPEQADGFYALFEGKPGDDPGCPAAFPDQGYAGNADLIIPDPGCPACTCGVPTGQTCNLTPAFISARNCATLTANPGSVCGRNRELTTDGTCIATLPIPAGTSNCNDPVNGTCTLGGTLPCNLAIRVDQTTVSGGSCTPSQPPMPLPLLWSKLALACRQPSGASLGQGCSGGQVCAPKVPAPFQPNLCVKLPGETVSCPALFPNKHVYYEGFNDARSCGDCSCSNPAGSSCSTTIQFFTDNICSPGALLKEVAPGTCGDLSNNPGISGRKAVGTQISPGSCAASGGLVSGAAGPAGGSTFCCK